MRLPDDYDSQYNKSSPVLASVVFGGALFIVTVLIVVALLNRKPTRTTETIKPQETPVLLAEEDKSKLYEDQDIVIPSDGLHPEDLDFWDKYPEKVETVEKVVEKEIEEQVDAVEEIDPATDGNHTLIQYGDGSSEWLLISPYLPKHKYDFTNLVSQSGLMKYYIDGKQVSYIGADISKYQDYVDFVKLKKAGVDFVMLRVGARGYGTGQLLVDDYFFENIKRATDAGLDIGVYFFSQAISEEEVLEEANLVMDCILDYEINYPIAFDMEHIANDDSRIDALSKNEKTQLAKTFLEFVSEAGYIPMLYGNKEWLLKEIDYSKLTEYDIWLSQPGDLPDYPYSFSMWQFSNSSVIDGIAGYADLNICFKDFTEK